MVRGSNPLAFLFGSNFYLERKKLLQKGRWLVDVAMMVKARAKINLALDVFGKRPDGFTKWRW